MNLGETTTAAFTLFEELGQEVTYLGRDFQNVAAMIKSGKD